MTTKIVCRGIGVPTDPNIVEDISMTIYASEKVMPYVYMCIHKQTGEFYIGSRYTTKQRLPSHQDFPQYQTSSKRVKPIFDQFDWFIVAEFLDRESAYTFEQQLIYEHWGDPKLLNGVCRHQNSKMFAPEKSTMSEERRQKLIQYNKSRLGSSHSAETKAKMSAVRKGKQWNEMTDEVKRKISEAKKGHQLTKEQQERHKEATAAANRARCLGKKRDPEIARKAWETRRQKQQTANQR
jgi:predicted GIY-YIG superfamily endonuclease